MDAQTTFVVWATKDTDYFFPRYDPHRHLSTWGAIFDLSKIEKNEQHPGDPRYVPFSTWKEEFITDLVI